MNINIKTPTVMEGKLLEAPVGEDTLVTVKPRRWSKTQLKLAVIPIESVNERGQLLDHAVITVNQRTGKLSIEQVSGSGEIPLDADTKGRR